MFVFFTLIISFNGFDLITNFTASLSCFNNIGPGLELVGPYGSYSIFNDFTTFVLSIEMIAGRLELMPILLLFSPKVWSSNN